MANIPKFNAGRVAPTPEEIAEASKPFFGNPHITAQAQKSKLMGNLNPPISVAGKPDFLRGSRDKIETAYAHCKNMNVPAAESEEIKVNFQSNVLDNYDMYTYHFKLFITSLDNSTNGKVMDPESQTIIAESGVTDFTIDKLELLGITTPSQEAGTGTQTLLKFEILEPSGAGLLDKMYYEALALGLGNWFVMPCYIELQFRGRTNDSSEPVTSGDPGTLSGLKWIWPIKISDIKAHVSSSGTRYDINAIFYDEYAQSNACFSLLHETVLSNLTKFGKAMAELSEKLNADAYEKSTDNYSIPDSYRIVVDPELANVNIAIAEQNKTSTRGADYVNLQSKVATYNPGTSIDKVVDSLLGSSDYYQRSLQSARTRTAQPNAANQAAPMRDFWRVITETRPIGFDPLRQDNAIEITIYVVKYNLGLVEADASQTGQTPDTHQAARHRLATYNNLNILRKKYNYIFTGLNDQVINFDLNMNFSFAAVLSRFGGIYLDSNNSDIGVVERSSLTDEKEAIEKVRKTLQFINKPENSATADIVLEATKSSVASTNVNSVLKSQLLNTLKFAKSADRTMRVSQIQAAGGRDADGELNRTPIIAKSLATPPFTNPSYKFVSDVDPSGHLAQKAREIAESNRSGKLRPMPFREGSQESHFTGIDSNSDAGRARTSSLFSTALYSTLDASLQIIKLTIKGDPFWLYPKNEPINGILPFKSRMPDQEAIDLIKRGHEKDTSMVNPFGTDNFIVIRFRTPKIYNDATGYQDAYSEVETFSGVYRVIMVTSRFEMGKFTQEMECQLDNLINLKDFPEFLKQLEQESAKPDPVVDTRNLSPMGSKLTDVQRAAITDRLKGAVPGLGVISEVKGKVDTLRDQAGNVITKVTSIGPNLSSNVPTLTDVQKAAIERLRGSIT